MSNWENGLFAYIEGRLSLLEQQGLCYFFRNNSFSGRIQRYDGSQGFIKNNKKGTPDVVACFPNDYWIGDFGEDINAHVPWGQFVGFELKIPSGRQSPEQKKAQEAIEKAGGKYFIIRTSEEFEEVLKRLVYA